MTCSVSISDGNIKLGKNIPNVNLSPPKVCKNMPCLTSGCYAMKSYRQWPSVRQSWNFNTDSYLKDPDGFFKDIIGKLSRKRNKPKHFRWHSAGETVDIRYFEGMKEVARNFPKIKFLCFTKKYGMAYYMKDCPKNLKVIFSSWPGLKMPKVCKDYALAWMHDGTEAEAAHIEAEKTGDLFACKGNCNRCKACWNVKEGKNNILFHKH